MVGVNGRCEQGADGTVEFTELTDGGAGVYANGRDRKDPMLSPIYGEVKALLQVYEAQSHAQFMRDTSAPETKEAFEEITQFFDKQLGR